MFEVRGLSKKDIQEEYEDLVFRKVMAIYAEKEGRQILSEIEKMNKEETGSVDSKIIEKIFDKKEQKENLEIIWKYSKKIVSFAAMLVFVAIISLSSVVVAFADVRETIAEYLYYYLTYDDKEVYTDVGVGDRVGFIDEGIYTWDNAYALTYITDNFELFSVKDLDTSKIVNYKFGDKYISFVQYTETTVATDTENADIVETITIGSSEGFLVVKKDWSCVFWSVGDTLLQVSGTAPTEEIIKIAENVKILK